MSDLLLMLSHFFLFLMVSACVMLSIAIWKSVLIFNALCDRTANNAVQIAATSALIEDGQFCNFPLCYTAEIVSVV